MTDDEMYVKQLNHYSVGEFKQSYILLKILCDKYNKVKINRHNASFILQIYCAYEVSVSTLGIDNIYTDKLILDHKSISPELRNYINKIYCMFLLKQKEYKKANEYIKWLQPVNGPGINPDNISYFNKGDKGKILLIYTSGGIGDIIMYSRFLRKICETNSNNSISFLIDDKLVWLFMPFITMNQEEIVNQKPINNLRIIPHSVRDRFQIKYDYHTNITLLMHHLDITYETLYIDYYLENIVGNSIGNLIGNSIGNSIGDSIGDTIDQLMDNVSIQVSNLNEESLTIHSKKTIIINWSGNKENIMERYNRSIGLDKLIPLFTKSSLDINWISINKNVSKKETRFLEKYNIKNYGPIIDCGMDAFKDTVSLLKKVDLVITTDTSLVHLAGTMNIPCWCLLTIGCDWRWTNGNNLKWYPNVRIFKQNTLSNWDNVVSDLLEAIPLI